MQLLQVVFDNLSIVDCRFLVVLVDPLDSILSQGSGDFQKQSY